MLRKFGSLALESINSSCALASRVSKAAHKVYKIQ